jgi:hypothetical protein
MPVLGFRADLAGVARVVCRWAGRWHSGGRPLVVRLPALCVCVRVQDVDVLWLRAAASMCVPCPSRTRARLGSGYGSRDVCPAGGLSCVSSARVGQRMLCYVYVMPGGPGLVTIFCSSLDAWSMSIEAMDTPPSAEPTAAQAATAASADTPESTAAPAACRHFRRGYCRMGSACRFAHTEVAAPASDRRGRRRTQRKRNLGRVAIFRRWLVDTYGDALKSGTGVVDVAGGRGALSFELLNVAGVQSTVVDPRTTLALGRLVQQWERNAYHAVRGADRPPTPVALPAHWAAYWTEALWRPLLSSADGHFVPSEDELAAVETALRSRPAARVLGDDDDDDDDADDAAAHEAHEGSDGRDRMASDAAAPAAKPESIGAGNGEPPSAASSSSTPLTTQTSLRTLPSAGAACAHLRDCSLVVGLHPDAATEAIVDFALAAGKCFAVVPCCVFAAAFSARRVGGQPVTTHAAFVRYLQAKDPERIRVAQLPFEGRNLVVYALPAIPIARDAECCAACDESGVGGPGGDG